MSAPVTTPDKLIELALRVVQATGPDPDLGHEIWDAVRGDDNDGAPYFTSSLDAAMQLVPEGLAFGCGRGTNEPDVEGWAWCGPDEGAYYFAATPALALCAAALSARALSHQGGQNG